MGSQLAPIGLSEKSSMPAQKEDPLKTVVEKINFIHLQEDLWRQGHCAFCENHAGNENGTAESDRLEYAATNGKYYHKECAVWIKLAQNAREPIYYEHGEPKADEPHRTQGLWSNLIAALSLSKSTKRAFYFMLASIACISLGCLTPMAALCFLGGALFIVSIYFMTRQES